jgi:hypothetical protein
MTTLTSLLLASLLSNSNYAAPLQAPAAPPAATPSAPSGQPAAPSSNSSGKSNNKPLPSFLILGTVYDEKALSLPGVQVRIRRAGEKKFRWETYTNSRGEFAVRVPPGYDYEVVSHMKNYQDQNQSVDAKVEVQQRLSIKLTARGQAKTGAKP